VSWNDSRLRGRARERGYILVATLFALALMALVAGRLAARAELLGAQSATLQQLADGTLAAENARARVLFALNTEALQSLALDPAAARRWHIDGTPTPLEGGIVAELQDHRGLANLNFPDRGLLTRLLIAKGARPEQVDGLIDKLNDYTDTDDLRRLAGAERAEYEALGLPAPRNDWLDSPLELRQIVGWRDLGPTLEAVTALTSGARSGSLNPNTAPRDVLLARLPGTTPEQVDAFIARRKIAPFRSAEEARSASGFGFTDNDVFFPGPTFRLRLRLPGLPMALEYNLLLTPESNVRPWHYLDSRTVFVPVSQTDEGGRAPGSTAVLPRPGPS